MSFSLPPVKVKPTLPDTYKLSEGSLGVQDLMLTGLSGARSDVEAVHPLALSETKYNAHKDVMNMTMLRNTLGLHAPLRISMELNSAKKIGRLPFLPSSNVMLDALTGRDLEIIPEDIFSSPDFMEHAGQPHAVVEKSLGLLH